jgi:hypothetical protein
MKSLIAIIMLAALLAGEAAPLGGIGGGSGGEISVGSGVGSGGGIGGGSGGGIGIPPKIEFSVSEIAGDVLESIVGVSWKEGCPVEIGDLRLVTVAFVNFEGCVRGGELVAHKAVADELADIFRELFVIGFPIERVELIDRYEADDHLSMDANNSSAFNYRTVDGSSSLSMHAYGLAVDINPVQNPYVSRGRVSPEAGREYASRSDARPGMVARGDAVYKAFTSRGWTWGGDWSNSSDYQHFQKMVSV